MKTRAKQAIVLAVAFPLFISSMGCGSLPWRAKAPVAMSADQYAQQTAADYAQQAAANIEYDTAAEFSRDDQRGSAARPSYTPSPSERLSTSSSCSSGCCH